ncbi:major facilitator superfamily domain-containing protein [Phthorimaea operculella]|nr:major facilitator superfamily domain-containing protein [Phthorimaea operculella]
MKSVKSSEIRSEKLPVTFDDVAMKFSLFGRYHAGFMVLIVLIYINDNITCGSYVFTAEKVNYRCADPRFGNNSCASLSNSTETCTEWIYDDPRSFVAEFNLACQEWKRTLVGTAQGFGYGVGLLFIGPLSDRWGRKKLIVITAVTSMITGVAKSFSDNYWIFVIFEFLGSAIGDAYSPAYILMIEMVAYEKRVLAKVICATASSIGYFIIPFIAWLFPYWRHMLLVFFGPAVFFLSYIFLLDESPRWLLSKGNKDKAIVILEKTARISKVEIDRDDLDNLVYVDDDVKLMKALKDTFTSKVLMKRFFLCLVWWIAVVFVSYGIRVQSVTLPGNKYINYALLGVATIPARLLVYVLLKNLTRKASLVITFLACAVVCVAQPFPPKSLQWLSTLLFMSGKLLVTTLFAVTYIFTSELFPTNTRNSIHALCSSLGRIGAILAPQTPLLTVYWEGLPSLTFGLVSLLAGVVTLLAPGTSDEVLPDTVQQAEAFGRPAEKEGVDNIAFENFEMKDVKKRESFIFTIPPKRSLVY